MTERKCKRCGKMFPPKNNKQTYCNPVCRIEYNKEKLIEDRKELKEFRSGKTNNFIRSIAAEAKAAGMSYGKYVAMIELQKGGIQSESKVFFETD